MFRYQFSQKLNLLGIGSLGPIIFIKLSNSFPNMQPYLACGDANIPACWKECKGDKHKENGG